MIIARHTSKHNPSVIINMIMIIVQHVIVKKWLF